MNQKPLEGQVALVTGASRGIGAAIAVELATAGATVIGTATSETGAQAIQTSLTERGLQGAGRVLDVRDAASAQALTDSIVKDHGGLAILVNNAGVTHDNLLMRMKDDEWDDLMQTNLRGAFALCRAAMRPMMKARFGRIINITSVVGFMGNAGQTNYCAAKAGLVGFSKALAREVGSRNITVNCVAPGFIDTDMTRNLPEEQIKRLTETIPLARLGKAEDIAHAVTFLASPQASYITGATLHVNGGMFMD